MEKSLKKGAGLFSAISLSVGTMLGSGWLFAPYYAAKTAGGASILSWIVGAIAVLIMALLLAEIAIKFPVNGLFTRLISLSHNKHFGFVTGISNWLLGLIIIPSEAMATTQYLASIFPSMTDHIYLNDELTTIGVVIVAFFMLIYLLVNFWGLKIFAKLNNSITTLKLIIPILTALIIMYAAFDSANFTIQDNTFIPFGTGSIFSAIVSCGIFYSFFGFQTAVSFTAEIKNPKKNVPIALISSIVIILSIYLLLQFAFIGALPADQLKNGWASLNFESPLAQLATILGINALAVILYADAAISPSGTGMIYTGASTRMLNEMAKHNQMPEYFARVNEKVNLSRTSLVFTFICSLLLIFFFRSWQLIASLSTTFIIISCLALPIAYAKLKSDKNETFEIKYLPFSQVFAFITYIFLGYLLVISGSKNIAIATILHIGFFIIYASKSDEKLINIAKSSLNIFLFFVFEFSFSVIHANTESFAIFYAIFLPLLALFYPLLIKQKYYKD